MNVSGAILQVWQGGHDDDEMSWLGIIQQKVGCPVRPAPVKGNKPESRIEAVSHGLSSTVGDFKPMMVVGDNCKMLCAGFNSGYQYGKQKIAGQDVLTPSPLKNKYSHIHDALQYLCVGIGWLRDVEGHGRGQSGVYNIDNRSFR